MTRRNNKVLESWKRGWPSDSKHAHTGSRCIMGLRIPSVHFCSTRAGSYYHSQRIVGYRNSIFWVFISSELIGKFGTEDKPEGKSSSTVHNQTMWRISWGIFGVLAAPVTEISNGQSQSWRHNSDRYYSPLAETPGLRGGSNGFHFAEGARLAGRV